MTYLDPNPYAMCDADGIPFDLLDICADAYPELIDHYSAPTSFCADGWTTDGGMLYSPACACGIGPGTSYSTFEEADAAYRTDLPSACVLGSDVADALSPFSGDGPDVVVTVPLGLMLSLADTDEGDDDDDW